MRADSYYIGQAHALASYMHSWCCIRGENPRYKKSEVIQLKMRMHHTRTPREGPDDISGVEIEMTCQVLILGYNLKLGNLIT